MFESNFQISISCVDNTQDEFKPAAADAGGGEEIGEDAGDGPQPAQARAEDEVGGLLILWLIGKDEVVD